MVFAVCAYGFTVGTRWLILLGQGFGVYHIMHHLFGQFAELLTFKRFDHCDA